MGMLVIDDTSQMKVKACFTLAKLPLCIGVGRAICAYTSASICITDNPTVGK
jgi:hypothetical protein